MKQLSASRSAPKVEQERDRQAPERQPNLSPASPVALAYKDFRFLRQARKTPAQVGSP